MAPAQLLVSLLPSLSLLLLVAHARPALDPSDLDALESIQKDLGIDAVVPPYTDSPCNVPGILCERRLGSNDTYVLRITRLIFKFQELKGFLSPAIGRLSELKELSLSNNKLAGQLPNQIVDCKKLEILNLRNNRLSGKIPSELSSLVRLRELDVASNRFTGDLSFLKHFPNLEKLSLADNLFDGKVPPSVRSFRNLRFFDVSGNVFLEGPVPSLDRVGPSDLNLRKRLLVEGRSSRSNTSAVPPTSGGASGAPAPSPLPPGPKGHRKERKILTCILGFLAGAIAGLISGFIFSLLFKLTMALIRGGRKETGISIFSPLIKKEEDLAFLEKEDGLASLEVIGSGGCGKVYRAELPGSNGKMIAIKKIIQPPKDATELAEEDTKDLNKKMRQIRSEIQTVGQIRHRNLLPLLAHLSRPDCHYLVYEYMKNGSLQDLLDKVSGGKTELDWQTRHRIALGVAAGLEYLHMDHNPRIIHRDLKPANVLIDDDMEARIADFGLAKAMPESVTHVTSSNVVGTLGYIAPEYHQTYKFTEKSDIYSFGVLLASLVMGKLPSDQFFQHTEEMSMVKWLRNVMISENPRRAIDPKLLGNGLEEQMLLVLKVAVFCTNDEAKQRPTSKDVRCMLSQVSQ